MRGRGPCCGRSVVAGMKKGQAARGSFSRRTGGPWRARASPGTRRSASSTCKRASACRAWPDTRSGKPTPLPSHPTASCWPRRGRINRSWCGTWRRGNSGTGLRTSPLGPRPSLSRPIARPLPAAATRRSGCGMWPPAVCAGRWKGSAIGFVPSPTRRTARRSPVALAIGPTTAAATRRASGRPTRAARASGSSGTLPPGTRSAP
jgi:hypothetical protein